MCNKFFVIISVFAIICSCDKNRDSERELAKEPQLSESTYRGLKVGASIPIDGHNIEGLSWSSNHYFVADINDLQRITPKHVGIATISSINANIQVYVEVTPRYTDYDLPIIHNTYSDNELVDADVLFGATQIYIKEQEKRMLDSRSNSSLLVYKTGNIKSPYIAYGFTDGKLTMAGSLINPDQITNLYGFLSERYALTAQDIVINSTYFVHMYGSRNKEHIDYMGGLRYYQQLGGILLAFMPYEKTKAFSDSNSAEILDEFARQLKQILK